MKLLLENWNLEEEKSKITNGYKIPSHVIPFSFELITIFIFQTKRDYLQWDYISLKTNIL